jgi:hypothetical protein
MPPNKQPPSVLSGLSAFAFSFSGASVTSMTAAPQPRRRAVISVTNA